MKPTPGAQPPGAHPAGAATASAVWVELGGGLSLPVGSGGLLIGRSAGAGLVLDHRAASKVHAAIVLGPAGAELLALGRNPTLVNGERVDGSRPLATGDRVQVPGATFTVRLAGGARPAPCWMIQDGESRLVRIAASPFTLGGGPGDGLQVRGWPAAAVRLWTAQGALLVSPRVTGTLDGRPLAPGDLVAARPGAALAVQQRALTLVLADAGDGSTFLGGEDQAPREIRFSFLPNGGRLELCWDEGPVALTLSEQRARLMGALLRPRPPYQAGEFVPDEVLLSAIWPGQERNHLHLNQLVHRLRTELARAGVDPFRVLERLKGGGATRVRIAPDCRVELD